MPTMPPSSPLAKLRLGLFVALSALPLVQAAPGTQLVSVYSKAMNGYARLLDANNGYKPETYTFAEGQRLDGLMRDPSIDKLTFMQIAQVMSQALKRQNYLPAAHAKDTDLLIFVSWGTTAGTEDRQYGDHMTDLSSSLKSAMILQDRGPNMEPGRMTDLTDAHVDMYLTINEMVNRERDRNNYFNAGILGYTAELRDAMFLKTFSTGFATEVISEVEESRYFVVLRAYDFKTLRRDRTLKQLWETRFSIRQAGNRFDRELPGMATYASKFFGQNLGRLVRRPMKNAEVQVGTPTIVDERK